MARPTAYGRDLEVLWLKLSLISPAGNKGLVRGGSLMCVFDVKPPSDDKLRGLVLRIPPQKV